MNKLLFISLFTLLFCSRAQGQSCFPDGLFISEQAVIDNFQSNNPGGTSIEGPVEISFGTDVTNLYGLSGITSTKQTK